MKTIYLALVLVTCSAADTVDYGDAISKIPRLGQLYKEDGAADGSIMNIGADDSGIVHRPLPVIKALVGLGPRAIPILINCLTDTRDSSAVFRTKKGVGRVPVGYVCLDILMGVIADQRDNIFVKDCADDGLGACVKPGYYFRPEVYDRNTVPIARQKIQLVKKNWTAALNRRIIRFRYPPYWQAVK